MKIKYSIFLLILFLYNIGFSQKSDNLTDSIVYFQWNESTNSWENNWKENHNISENKILQSYGYEADSITFEWAKSWKYTYSYNSSNKINQWTSFDWVNNYWVNYCKADYTYNSNSDLYEVMGYDYYAPTLAWVSSWKEQYTYDNNQNLGQCLISDWRYQTNTWRNSWKANYTYLTDNKKNEYIYYNWDTINNVWSQYQKGNYYYYAGTDIVELTVYEYLNNNWTISYREIYTENSKSNVTIKIGYKWDSETFSWINSWKYVYYWTETTSTNNISKSDNIEIYPNPCENFATLKFENIDNQVFDIELYNTNGQILYSQKSVSTTNNYQLDLTAFQSGVYVVIFKNNTNQFSKTLIKK